MLDLDNYSIPVAVDAGIALLTEVVPNFETEIEWETLDINSGSDCVLGQLYGSWQAATAVLYVLPEEVDDDAALNLDEREWAQRHGFWGVGTNWTDLENEWRHRFGAEPRSDDVIEDDDIEDYYDEDNEGDEDESE